MLLFNLFEVRESSVLSFIFRDGTVSDFVYDPQKGRLVEID